MIYKRGHRKKILETFTYSGAWEHFSLEWRKERAIVVRKYDDLKHEILLEKEVRLSGN